MKKDTCYIGICFFTLLLIVSIIMIAGYYISEDKAEDDFNQLIEMVEEAETKKSDTENEEVQSPLERYQELFDMNNDMYGWISIDGTNINYPVMYVPGEKDYYLKRNFKKEYSAYGVPYIAEHCDPVEPDDNVIIYGHHMKNGSMFSDLMKYDDKKFFLAQKTFNFDSLTETAMYEIIAVFKTTVYDDSVFKFYEFAKAQTKEEFDSYVAKCKELSLYETGVNAEYGDKLLTLSTCEYSRKNGRMVIVAKKVLAE